MSTERESASSAPQPKYSRYRSVRHVPKPVPEPVPVPVPAPQQRINNNDFSRTKSMARYRRSRLPGQHEIGAPAVPSVPIPAVPGTDTELDSPSGYREPRRRVTEPVPDAHHSHHSPTHPERSRRPSQETENDRLRRKVREFQEREEEQRRKESEREREHQERRREKRRLAEDAEEQRRIEEETDRILAEQKRKDLERLQAELAAAPAPPPAKSPRFGLFSRKRSHTQNQPSSNSSGSGIGNREGSGTGPPSLTQTRSNEPPRSGQGILQGGGGIVPQTDAPILTRINDTKRPVQNIKEGGAGVVPQIDAPISASNAGERRVMIRCKQSSINLPITPETTPIQLIYSATNVMTHDISPASAVLLESYLHLGLERPIRKYEHIRDIMNSWDRDTQNALILQSSDKNDIYLEASSAPKDAPENVTMYMYHSQRPGKWNKRYVTLLSTGQMFISKKPGGLDKDSLNICHLSDYDIYSPTPQQSRKTLKPPKKYCHAIKSQQKTTMFLSTENFVHFFSTDDIATSERWYWAVQRWRSWYLVSRKGDGKESSKGKTVKDIKVVPQARPGTRSGPGHKIQVSVDENPYTIGSFTPLINMDRFDADAPGPDDDDYDSEEEDRPRQIPFHLRNSVNLSDSAVNRRDTKRHPPVVAMKVPHAQTPQDEEFASSGLLGRTYTQKLHVQKDREAAHASQAAQANGFVGGFMDRSNSIRSVRRSEKRPETSAGPGQKLNSLTRSASQRNKPKPLLDFTPQFKEAPQWDKTNKGQGVQAPQGALLVDLANTPETGMNEIPKASAVFRRDMRPATSAGGPPREGPLFKGGLVNGVK